ADGGIPGHPQGAPFLAPFARSGAFRLHAGLNSTFPLRSCTLGYTAPSTEPEPHVELYSWLPPEAVKIVLVLFLSFLIGLEREEHKASGSSYSFGGVRTFPLIGFIGYSIALLSGAQLLPVTLGFLVVGGFLLLSYWHKLSRVEAAGVTS